MGKANKRGRKRKQGLRTPSGQLSRSQEAREVQQRIAFEEGPQQTVLQARRRHMGKHKPGPVTKEEAQRLKLYDRGSPLGDWLAQGKLTRGHIEVAGDFAARCARYRKMCGLPKATAQVGAYGAVRGGSGDPDPEQATAARRAHMADQAELQRCAAGTRKAMHDACVCLEPAPLWLVKQGIEALARLHGVDLDERPGKAA
jgi:hypothetical protein